MEIDVAVKAFEDITGLSQDRNVTRVRTEQRAVEGSHAPHARGHKKLLLLENVLFCILTPSPSIEYPGTRLFCHVLEKKEIEI